MSSSVILSSRVCTRLYLEHSRRRWVGSINGELFYEGRPESCAIGQVMLGDITPPCSA